MKPEPDLDGVHADTDDLALDDRDVDLWPEETVGIAPKVATATLAGALVTVLTWLASTLGLDVPPEVAAALVTAVAALVGYLSPPARTVP